MSQSTDLLVVGAGPYAYSAAAFARDNGIDTHVLGQPMAFWRDQMPADMFLRSGPDWHLDGSGTYTFEAFFEDRGLRPEDHDPIPREVFLDYTEWFRERTKLEVDRAHGHRPHRAGRRLRGHPGRRLDDHRREGARRPGIRHFVNLPEWYDALPPDRRAHTSELVSFDDLAGARVVIIGGRQSAYEWAALLCDHGAERVDVVHRHPTPDFAQGQLGLRRPVRRPDARAAWLVAAAARPRAAGHRGRVLAGRPAHAGALAGAAARPPRS